MSFFSLFFAPFVQGGMASYRAVYTPSGDECPDIGFGKSTWPSKGGDGVYGGDSNGKGGLSNGEKNKDGSSGHSLVYIMAGVGGLLIIAVVVLGVIFYQRRKHRYAEGSQSYATLHADEDE